MRFHPFFYVLLFTFYVLIALLGFSSISLAEEGKWTKKADMPTPRWVLSTSVVNGKIYAVGGSGGAQTVEEYDPETDTWTKKADMPTARRTATSVVNGKIYAIGGYISGVGALSTVEEYDPQMDKWTKKADMPTIRGFGLSASSVNGKIYAIGGSIVSGAQAFSTVEEYDPMTDTWTKKADMPTARYWLSTSVVNGKIYAIGGWSREFRAISTVEEYDPMTNTWAKKADMPTAREILATSVVNGIIYAIGGSSVVISPGFALSVVERYNPTTDTWTKVADMPTERFGLAASVVNGKIYAIGGAKTGLATLSTVEEYDTGFAGEEIDFYIHNVSPSFGDPKGGALVQIQGEGFIVGSKLFFGGVESNKVQIESSSLITAIAPPNPTDQVDVEVVRPDGKKTALKNGYQYVTFRAIKINPASAPITGGITIQIEGFGFQPGVEVKIGDKKLANLFVTPFLIQGKSPAGNPGVVDVVATNLDGEKSILPQAFSFISSPTIERVSSDFVSVLALGKELTIKGSGFMPTPTVHIGRFLPEKATFISSEELKILLPSLGRSNDDLGPKDVIVTNPDGQKAVLPNGVTVLAPIKIKSVEPDRGGLGGGTKITIVGEEFAFAPGTGVFPSRFVEGAEVSIGNVEAEDVTIQSDNIITAITPPNTPGPKSVEVINPDGRSDLLSNAFSYNPLPQIIKVIPNNGPLSGGTKITIQGSKFLPGAKVLIGDVDVNSYIVAPSPEVASDAFITAITPKVPIGDPGLRDVVVVNPDGQEVVLRDGYRYNPLPTIRDLSPSYGPSSGGTKIIIRGTGFLLGARVIIGKRPATTEFKDDSTIEAVTPANPKGRLDVKVLNPDTQEAVIPRAFISVGELAYNYPNPFTASQGTTFRYVPGPNEIVESIVVRIFNLAGVPIGVVGAEGSNEVRWQDSKVNVGLYVYMMEVRVGGKVKRFKRALEVYK